MSSFAAKVRKRLAEEESGWTLVEMLIVLEILAILLLAALPSYIQFEDRARKAAAASNVSAAVPAVQRYWLNNSTYAGMTGDVLASQYSPGLKIVVVSGDVSTFCIRNTVGGWTYYKNGPSGDITTTACT